MNAQFGDAYAQSVAKDQVLAALGDRTVNQALADGEDAKVDLAGGVRHVRRARAAALSR